MYNAVICERALTRTARKAFRKAGLHESFVHNCYVWFGCCSSGNAKIGNFILFSGKFTAKDSRRLSNILPHVLKSVRKTAKACGFKGNFELDGFLQQWAPATLPQEVI